MTRGREPVSVRFDLDLARMHHPELLILDEPLADLDPVSQQTFLEDSRRLARGEHISNPGRRQHGPRLSERVAAEAGIEIG